MNNIQTGAEGEELARRYLTRKGYELLHRNYRTRYGEIDLIMRDGEYTVFVEVKTRSGKKFGRPAEAVDSGKQSRIISCAMLYFQEHGEVLSRFDIIEILGKNITHIMNAFEAPGG